MSSLIAQTVQQELMLAVGDLLVHEDIDMGKLSRAANYSEIKFCVSITVTSSSDLTHIKGSSKKPKTFVSSCWSSFLVKQFCATSWDIRGT